MASQQQVKQYLAYWFLVGKSVYINNGQDLRKPESVLQRDRFSSEFENCWQEILTPESGHCYLQGTEQTVEELLSSDWNLEPCARCQMPIPLKNSGVKTGPCPCVDLENWPNNDLPRPHLPVNNQQHLSGISKRVQNSDNLDQIRTRLERTQQHSPDFPQQKSSETGYSYQEHYRE
ncbi:MAG: hypothetical protein RI580_17325 [Halothece sp. Uz-M2-17]|nr:hypothetical protein [Halothece sp. Uz-M2-17]